MKYLLTIALTLSISFAYAQDGTRLKRLEAHKIAFITEGLDLSPKEAQVFWPLYNEYRDQVKAVKESYSPPSKGDMSEAEAEAMIKAHFDHQAQLLQLEKDYVAKLDGVISNKKQLRLLMIERNYRKEILKKLRKRLKSRDKRDAKRLEKVKSK